MPPKRVSSLSVSQIHRNNCKPSRTGHKGELEAFNHNVIADLPWTGQQFSNEA